MTDRHNTLTAQLAAAQPLDEAPAVPLDKRIVGEQSRLLILQVLHRFGWLSSRMVAALGWPTAAQGWQMARRTLKAMQEDGTVIKRPTNGTDVFLLSAKGARLLNDMTGSSAASGQNLALGNPVHRACSNWALIDAMAEGLEVITEHELATDRLGVRAIDGKVPDGVILHEGGDAVVLEVENSWKATKAREAIAGFCARHLDRDVMTPLTATHDLRRVRVVATNVDALRHMASTFLAAYRAGQLTESQLHLVEVSVLPVTPSLVPGERVHGQLWYDVIEPYLRG